MDESDAALMPGLIGRADPYEQGRWTQTLPPDYRRVAPETYWRIRSSSASVREWASHNLRLDKSSQMFHDLWGVAESVDLTLEHAHRQGGFSGVQWTLENDDRLEHWLSRLGSQVALQLTGDKAMALELSTSRAPGGQHILPDWRVTAARDVSRSPFRQEGRVRVASSRGRSRSGEDSDGVSRGGGSRRRRRGGRRRGREGDGVGGIGHID